MENHAHPSKLYYFLIVYLIKVCVLYTIQRDVLL